jgi:hypothetical protein
MEKFGIFYAHFEYITASWYTLRSFDNFAVIWYIFPVLVLKNLASGNPAPDERRLSFYFNFCFRDIFSARKLIIKSLPAPTFV